MIGGAVAKGTANVDLYFGDQAQATASVPPPATMWLMVAQRQ